MFRRHLSTKWFRIHTLGSYPHDPRKKNDMSSQTNKLYLEIN